MSKVDGRAAALANQIAALTTLVWHKHGPDVARAAIHSEKGPEPIYSQFRKQGLTFNTLYSDDETLNSYLPPDMFLIMPRKKVKEAWGLVRKHRANTLRQLGENSGAVGARGGAKQPYGETEGLAGLGTFVYGEDPAW